jgi:hypothetical protein
MNAQLIPVQLFPPLQEKVCVSPACKMGCEGCGKGPARDAARLDVNAVRALVERDHPEAALWVADYSTPAGRAEAIARINRLLGVDNIKLTVTDENLEEFIAQSAPVLAVGDRIASIIILPTPAGLAQLIADAR